MQTYSRTVSIPVGPLHLDGDLLMPEVPRGLVLFAHGSGSSRFSPRNRQVAEWLSRGGLATVLFDLLSEEEEEEDLLTQEYRFNIRLLAERVATAVDWAQADPQLYDLPVCLFGASTGAAAALVAAAARQDTVAAVVSRGGRPDLAGDALGLVQAPTLLLVGGRDVVVQALNEDAMRRIPADAELRIVPGAGHLFEEPGALEQVCREATSWFLDHLQPAYAPPPPP